MLEMARLLETADELLVLRFVVAAESEVELCAPPAFVVGEAPREFAYVLEFVLVPPRTVDPDAEFAGPLRPKYGDAVEPRLAVDAEEPLLYPRAPFAADEPKRALEGGVTPARLPAL
jgi:hypothetical protein